MKNITLAVMLLLSICLCGEIMKISAAADYLEYSIRFDGTLYEGNSFWEIEADNNEWNINETKGAPALPFKIINVAVPPAGRIAITVTNEKQRTMYLDKPILPAPAIIDGKKSSEYIYNVNESLYTAEDYQAVKQGEMFFYRGFSVIPVMIYPVDYDHQQKKLTIRESFDIEIKIMGNVNWRGVPEINSSWITKDFIDNYEQARLWRISPEEEEERGIKWGRSQFWYRIDTAGPGIYELDDADLKILPEFADLAAVRIFSLEPDGVESYQQREIAAAVNIEDRQVRFQYDGEGTVLWMSLAGDYEKTPLRADNITGEVRDVKEIREWQRTERSGREIDIVMIRPEGYFEEAAEELAQIHEEHYGLVSTTYVQEDIFAEQSGGVPEAVSIKNFLQVFYDENPSLDYVILLGSGTDTFSYSYSKCKIITYRTNSFAADDQFVAFGTGTDAGYPWLAIGRIPAKSEAMMSLYLERLRYYLEETENGWWQNKIMLVADDENKTGGLEGLSATSGMNHTRRMEDTAELLSGRILEKIYGIEYSFDSYNSKPGVTADMVDAINSGVLISYYIGHGSWNNMGDEDYFSNSDISSLQNNDHLFHFMAASCNVGLFDMPYNDCMAELLLFHEDGGAIISLAASEGSGPASNVLLMASYLQVLSDENLTTGKALLYAKTNSGASIGNSNKYNLLGDPVLKLSLPAKVGNVSGIPDEILRRQTVTVNGDFGDSRLNTSGEIQVYDSEQLTCYSNFIPPDTLNVYEVEYYKTGSRIFRGDVAINSGEYQSSYIVPDDADAGSHGSLLTLASDADGNWINCLDGIVYRDSSLNVENAEQPEVTVYLDSRNFRSGDVVSSQPLLIADIYDANGINVSGSPGKSMLMLIDDSDDPDDLIDVTDGFLYNENSYTAGTLSWKLDELESGEHNLKLIVYDNFGSPAVSSTEFSVKKGSISINDLLPYPNPMSDSGYFTFVLTEAAEVSISIYTISGKKIKTLHMLAETGYNQQEWDCRDADGDRLANNTYFYKVKAIGSESGKSVEATGKLIILN